MRGRALPSHVLLGLDDTDSSRGGCTTHTALRLAHAIQDAGGPLTDWALIDAPRLVRLNPSAPHKTRGNGALVLPIGPTEMTGPTHAIGMCAGAALRVRPAAQTCHPHEPTKAEADALRTLVDEHLPPPHQSGDTDPQPGAILVSTPPPASLYEAAIATTLQRDALWRHAPDGTLRLTPEPRRGDLGALAATAWPGTPHTWETIRYRRHADTPRHVPATFVDQLAAIPGAFDNHDPHSKRIRALPRTPCPIHNALRGTDPEALLRFRTGPDPTATDGPDHWLLRTNQATGDHARHATPNRTPHAVVRTQVTITSRPIRRTGGHLFVSARDEVGPVTLAAYEPTKTLRDALATTHPGDLVTVLARTAHDPDILALEAFRYDAAPPRHTPGPAPRCPACQRAMDSAGRNAGYRCRPCHETAPESARGLVTTPGPTPHVVHQVPDHVRGHLLPPPDGLPAGRSLDGAPGPAIPPVLSLAQEAAHIVDA